ncbi:uncharacterized protein FOMMEDRAFT_160827 [Fomitiporia mediterranea MF3/22]|uniref:uncharacterized protein n=1 Tax=Fomitiporia mediterranea (strain MF3/22) TaxID=694068 RepID=UPI0004407ACC|nr:uncharacterized protein FOMMEDRAFT_160827 [Fomitiporia mediterranea MF3/22]EJC99234.1 hypothetical protein FOMMEDRAFT_160827 [Fomitiporia mediterranea MF3/22]
MSSTIVDDTDSRFNYKDNAWKPSGQSGELDSTSHSTSLAGAVLQFGPFTGTSVTVFGTVHPSQPKVHFQVDGGSQNDDLPATSSTTAEQFQQQFYSATGLDQSSQHMLNINVLDAGPFTIDYLIIENGQSVDNQPVSNLGGQSVHNILTSGPSGTINSSTSSGTRSVGGTVTSTSISIGPGPDPTSPSASSTPSSSSPTPPSQPTVAAPGSNPTSSSTAGASPAASGSTTPGITSGISDPSTTAASMSASNGTSDAVVIGSVAGAIAFFAIVVVSMVLFLRRRRLEKRGRTVPNNKPSGWKDSQPQPSHRPSLHLSIPSALSLPRSLSRPSLLPTHNNKMLSSTTKQSPPFGTSHPTPSFLSEDPNESPIFDIKQRPVSGSTVTTRVTVGTTIGQRVSVPDSAYRYPYLETPVPVPVPVPPIPVLPSSKGGIPSPTETGVSSVTASPSRLGFAPLGTNFGTTFDASLFSGFSENGSEIAGSGGSASRPLPHTPVDAKRALETYDRAPQTQMYTHNSHSHRFLPTTPTPSDVETVVHRDAGVRLALNVPGRPRRELPPPYQDYGF